MSETAATDSGGASAEPEGGGAQAESGGARGVVPSSRKPLPDVVTALSSVGAVARLERASKRGRLPGFQKLGSGSDAGPACEVAAFGEPFDKKLLVSAAGEESGGAGRRTRLSFRLRLARKAPGLFALALLLTIWPGEPLTDSTLKNFGWYSSWVNPNVQSAAERWLARTTGESVELETWMWYYPLTVPSVALAWWSVMRKTERSTDASAREVIAKIAAEVGGEAVAPRLRR